MRLWLLIALAYGTAAFVGCSEQDTQTRFRVSGNVNFAGAPVPYGEVLFTPDGAADNSGAQGIATIRNGKYDTSAEGGKGVGGGPTVVRVTALADEKASKLLCEYDYKVDLPKEDSTLTIEVPASAANKKPGTPEI